MTFVVPVVTSGGASTVNGSAIRIEMPDPNSDEGSSFVGDLDVEQIRLERGQLLIAALGLKGLLKKD